MTFIFYKWRWGCSVLLLLVETSEFRESITREFKRRVTYRHGPILRFVFSHSTLLRLLLPARYSTENRNCNGWVSSDVETIIIVFNVLFGVVLVIFNRMFVAISCVLHDAHLLDKIYFVFIIYLNHLQYIYYVFHCFIYYLFTVFLEMPHYCIVPLCTNNSKLSEISFYHLPLHDKNLLQRWFVNIRRVNTNVSEHSGVSKLLDVKELLWMSFLV